LWQVAVSVFGIAVGGSLFLDDFDGGTLPNIVQQLHRVEQGSTVS